MKFLKILGILGVILCVVGVIILIPSLASDPTKMFTGTALILIGIVFLVAVGGPKIL
jgi:uncharacterized membrane protein HdeD (DUF308 family)